MRSSKEHKWRETDDIVALYLTLHGTESLGPSLAQVSEQLGIKASTMKMRIKNFNGKLTSIAPKSIKVRDQYKTFPEPELRAIVRGILLRASE